MSHSFEAVTTQRLYRVIADQIAERIREGEFAAGSRLPAERELAEQLQVSRASVREALIALEISGYVDVRVGSGVFVVAPRGDGGYPASLGSDPASQPIWLRGAVDPDMSPFELLDVRMLLEPDCAGLAAQHATPAQIDAIRQAQQAMTSARSPNTYDRAFHGAIAAACGNAALESCVSHIWDLSEASPVFRRLDEHFVNDQVWDVALAEHARILAAIEERDPIRARHAMSNHLTGIVARLREDAPEALAPRGAASRQR